MIGPLRAELSWFGRLRKLHHCGPVSMFSKLCAHWSARRPTEVAEKVRARVGGLCALGAEGGGSRLFAPLRGSIDAPSARLPHLSLAR